MLPRTAPLDVAVHKNAREKSLKSHISRWTKIDEGDEDAKHTVDFGSGVRMKLKRFPMLPRRGEPLADYGIPVSVRLLLKLFAEGALVFLIMFLLSVGSLTNNTFRSDARKACRRAAATPQGYAVLTNSSATTVADHAAIEAQLGFPPRECGYTGLPIRHFESLTIDSRYQHSGTITLINTGLGGCAEYRDCNATEYEHCDDHILPRGPWERAPPELRGNPLLVRTPGARFCLGYQVGSASGQIAQFIGQLLFLAFLARIRWISQYFARTEDSSRITTADYSLAVSGLDSSIPPDELKKQLKEQLEAVEINGVSNFLKDKIHHVEVGRNCRAEVALMKRLNRLVLNAEEATARMRYKEKKSRSIVAEKAKLDELATEFDEVQKEMKRLVLEPDTSTGHAFIVFHEELDRNKCYTHFKNALAATKGKYGSAIDGRAIACASTAEVESSQWWQVFEWACSLQQRRVRFQLQAAPEPDQINWDALEFDDWHEQKVVILGRLITLLLVGVGAVCLLAAKFGQFAFLGNPSNNHQSTEAFLATQSTASAITAGVTLVTLFFNALLRWTSRRLVNWEGQDTRTEEQSSLFSKLSLALSINTVIVPLLVGLFLCNGNLGDQSWYEPGGMVSSMALLCVFNYANDLNQVVNVMPIFRRYVLSRTVYSEPMLASFWKPVSFDMGNHYARCLVMMSLGLIYGPLYPLAYLITAVGLILKWLCTRFAMHTWYGFPVNIDQEMMMALRWRLGNVAGIACLVQCLCIAETVGLVGSAASWATLGSKALEAAGLTLFGTPILLFLYTIIPLGYIKGFARFDQLEDADDEDSTDTAGLRFDDAAKKEGYPMPHYVCPTLPNDASKLLARRKSSLMVASAKLEEDISTPRKENEAIGSISADVVRASMNLQRASELLAAHGLNVDESVSATASDAVVEMSADSHI
jgi:hypothetical protein